ncbi:MAG: hypothetical protein ACYTE5_09465 [Planctomycetota bacterium]|jgi:hypothetical protein
MVSPYCRTIRISGGAKRRPLHAIVVCRAWPGCYMVMSGKIMTQLPDKVQTQPDGGEG